MSEKQIQADWITGWAIKSNRGRELPLEHFKIQEKDNEDFFKKLMQTATFKVLSDGIISMLGWTLKGFQIVRREKAFRFYDYNENEIECSNYNDTIDICIIGNAGGTLKTFFTNLFQFVFPQHTLLFEDVTSEKKQQRLEREKLERQRGLEEEATKRRVEREQERIRKLLDNLTPLDYEILELRKQGVSFWGICKELKLTINCVNYRLKRMSQIPELVKDWPLKLQPLTRVERMQLQKAT